jgi:aminoglycoside 6'-N-acetyltransferase I
MNIRTIEVRDRDEWLRMRCAMWPDGQEDHAGEIDRFFQGTSPNPEAVLVADSGDGLAGFAELSTRPYAEGCHTGQVGYLEGWHVDPAFRRSGLGRALLRAAEQWARGRGYTEFASDSMHDNELSRRAHLACGFEEVALVRCFRKPLYDGP